MNLSPTGIALIKKWEGCRLTAYQDSVGVWTIGYGHTAAAGGQVPKAGMTITQKEADDLFLKDVQKYVNWVNGYIKREATQNEFDAMVSLCYNIGPGNFAKSSVLRRHNLGDKAGAGTSFLLWNKGNVNGKLVVIQGLVNRRKEESDLYLKETVVPVAEEKKRKSLWEWLKEKFS